MASINRTDLGRNGLFKNLLLLHYFALLAVKAEIVQEPKDTEVLLGHSTYFSCSTSFAPKEIFWYHYQVNSDERHEVYELDMIYPRYKNRFQITKNSSQGDSKLLIEAVRLEDAGRYECLDEDGGGSSSFAQLVVLETVPVCQSDIQPDGVLGPNDCDLEQDKLQLACRIAYRGNIPPQIEWLKVGENQSFSNELVNYSISATVSIYNLTLESALDMDNSSYMCRTMRSATSQYICIVENINIIHALDNKSSANKSLHEIVTCVIKSSQSCNYSWSREGESIAFEKRLKLQNAGSFECKAACIIRNHSCIIKGMKVYVIPTVPTGSRVLPEQRSKVLDSVVPASVVSAIFIVVIIGLIITNRKRERRLESYATENRVILYQNRAVREFKRKKDARIAGMAILNGRLYLLSLEWDNKIEVYSLETQTPLEPLQLNDVYRPWDAASCSVEECLYVMNRGPKSKEILKIDASGKIMKKWKTHKDTRSKCGDSKRGDSKCGDSKRGDSKCGDHLSVSERNVILTDSIHNKIIEYNPDGAMISEINLPKAKILHPQHAIKLANDQYVVCYGDTDDKTHGICIVNSDGEVTKSFAGVSSSNMEEQNLNVPVHLNFDSEQRRIIVADYLNKRVLILNIDLDIKEAALSLSKENVNMHPVRLCLHNGDLYVAVNKRRKYTGLNRGRVIVATLEKVSAPISLKRPSIDNLNFITTTL